MKENQDTFSAWQSARLWIRMGVHVAFWLLLLVWIVQPQSPSRFYRIGIIASFGILFLIALWPRVRMRLMAFVRRRIRLADILMVNLLLFIVLAEASVWVLGEVYDSPLLAPADAYAAGRIRHHRGRPHGIHNGQRLNALGFFDTEFESSRKPDVRRIVALADSFGAGVVPYEQNFLTLLDSELDEQEATEVYNFGIPGAGPPEYLYLYRTEACTFDPDKVLLCFFIGNDFVETQTRSILHADRLRSLALVKRLIATKGVAGDVAEPVLDEPTFMEESFLQIEQRRLDICRVTPDHHMRRRIEDTFRYLDDLYGETGSRLRVALIPDEYQVNDALYNALVKDKGNEFDRDRPNRLLHEYLDARGIPYLDLLGALREAESMSPTYKPRDTHWNVLGNSVAARALARWLEKES